MNTAIVRTSLIIPSLIVVCLTTKKKRMGNNTPTVAVAPLPQDPLTGEVAAAAATTPAVAAGNNNNNNPLIRLFGRAKDPPPPTQAQLRRLKREAAEKAKLANRDAYECELGEKVSEMRSEIAREQAKCKSYLDQGRAALQVNDDRTAENMRATAEMSKELSGDISAAVLRFEQNIHTLRKGDLVRATMDAIRISKAFLQQQLEDMADEEHPERDPGDVIDALMSEYEDLNDEIREVHATMQRTMARAHNEAPTVSKARLRQYYGLDNGRADEEEVMDTIDISSWPRAPPPRPPPRPAAAATATSSSSSTRGLRKKQLVAEAGQ